MALKHDYDEIADVLYLIASDAPGQTTNMTLDEHIVLRMDPATRKVVGLMVHDVTSIIEGTINNETLPVIAETFSVVIDSINALRERPDARAMLLAG